MAKSISVSTSHEYTSRAGTMTVGEALAWVERFASSEDEESGEVSTYSPGDLIVYAVRRMQALHKDGARVAKGTKPARIYTPRVAQVEGAAKNAGAVKEAAREMFAKVLHLTMREPAPAKPTRKPRKVAPVAKPAPVAEPKPAPVKRPAPAKPAAPAIPSGKSKPAPVAKPPTVRKHARPDLAVREAPRALTPAAILALDLV